MQPFECESVLELLNQVRVKTNPPGPTFIDILDEHVQEALPSLINGESSLNRGDVLEIQGPSGSGKTHLLYFMAMSTVLPLTAVISYTRPDTGAVSHHEVFLGGRNKAVALFDCDRRWSTARLHGMISAHIILRFQQVLESAGLPTPSDRELIPALKPSVAELCHEALTSLRVYEPTSSISLAATLKRLPTHLKRDLPDKELCMLMIDGMSNFYWSDRWTAEQAQSDTARVPLARPAIPSSMPRGAAREAAPPQPAARVPTPHPMEFIVSAIQSLRLRLGIVTLITNWFLPLPMARPPTQSRMATQSSSSPWRQTQSSATLQPKLDPHHTLQHLPAPYPHPFLPHPSALTLSTTQSQSPFGITHHLTLSISSFISQQRRARRNAHVKSIIRKDLATSSPYPSSSLDVHDVDEEEEDKDEERHFVARIRTPVMRDEFGGVVGGTLAHTGVPGSGTSRMQVKEGKFRFGISERGMVWYET